VIHLFRSDWFVVRYIQRSTLNPAAATKSAAAVWYRRVSTENAPTAALALLPLELAEGVERSPVLVEALCPMVRGAEVGEVFMPDAVDAAAVVAGADVAGDATLADDDAAEDDTDELAALLVAGAEDAVEEEPAEPVETALPPTTEPTPQGIVVPCWVGVAAAVVAPDALAMVKRVVHKTLLVEVEVNW